MLSRQHFTSMAKSRFIAGFVAASVLAIGAVTVAPNPARADDGPVQLDVDAVLATGGSSAPKWGYEVAQVTEDHILVTHYRGHTAVVDIDTGETLLTDEGCEVWRSDRAALTDTALTCLDWDGNIRRIDIASGAAQVVEPVFESADGELPRFVSATDVGWLQVDLVGDDLYLQEVEISGGEALAPSNLTLVADLDEGDYVTSAGVTSRNDGDATGAVMSFVHNFAEGGSQWHYVGIIRESATSPARTWALPDHAYFGAFGHGILVTTDYDETVRADTAAGLIEEWDLSQDAGPGESVITYGYTVNDAGVMWLQYRNEEYDQVEWTHGQAGGVITTVTDHWIVDVMPQPSLGYEAPMTVNSWDGTDYVVSATGIHRVVGSDVNAQPMYEFPARFLEIYGVSAEDGIVYWSDDSQAEFGTNAVWSRSISGDDAPSLLLERATGRALAVADGAITTHVVKDYPDFTHAVVRVDNGVTTEVVDGPYNGQQVAKQHYTAVTGACNYPNPPTTVECDDDWNVLFVPHDGGAIVEATSDAQHHDVNHHWHVSSASSYSSVLTAQSRTSAEDVTVEFASEEVFIRSLYLFDDVVYVTYEELDSVVLHIVAVDLVTAQVEELTLPAGFRIARVLDIESDHMAVALTQSSDGESTQLLGIFDRSTHALVATGVIATGTSPSWYQSTRAALDDGVVVWTRMGDNGDELVAARFAEPENPEEPQNPEEPVEPIDFSDVSEAHPFAAEISWLVAEGVTTGYDDGTFRPSASVSRMAMAAFLYRFAGEPEAGGGPSFGDVGTSHPFLTEITWLASTGVTTGYDDGTFRPAVSVSRMAMAAFLYRFAGEPAFEAPATASFSDVPTSHPFFAEVEWLASTGVTMGYDDGTFRPSASVSRMAMAAFLKRFSELDA